MRVKKKSTEKKKGKRNSTNRLRKYSSFVERKRLNSCCWFDDIFVHIWYISCVSSRTPNSCIRPPKKKLRRVARARSIAFENEPPHEFCRHLSHSKSCRQKRRTSLEHCDAACGKSSKKSSQKNTYISRTHNHPTPSPPVPSSLFDSFSLHGFVTLLFLRCLSCLLSCASDFVLFVYMCMCIVILLAVCPLHRRSSAKGARRWTAAPRTLWCCDVARHVYLTGYFYVWDREESISVFSS